MKKSLESPYLFALCNSGSEKALKLEVEALNAEPKPEAGAPEVTAGELRLSYQRPGFVSFKSDTPLSLAATRLPLACARRLCLSLGKSTTREEAVALLGEGAWVQHARLHERELRGVGQDGRVPKAGQLVGTVVELGESEFWTGAHRHGQYVSPDPAGDSGVVLAEDSPSRAWLKLEEAVRFFGLTLSPADIVVELGCAPGGVALALLRRGVSVIGVDPADIADVVTAYGIPEREAMPAKGAWFFHCRKPAALVSKRDLGRGVSWFMSDMNHAPEVVLAECARFCTMAPSIRGVLLTLKLGDVAQVVRKPGWLAALKAMGFTTIRLQQLSVHHKELALLGLRESPSTPSARG